LWGLGYFSLAPLPARFDPSTALDLRLPFVGAFLWVYLAGIVWIILPACLIRSRRRYRETASAYAIALLVAFICFALMPTATPSLRLQAATAAPGGWTGTALALLHRIDGPSNVLPSLHVALAWLAAHALVSPPALRSGMRSGLRSAPLTGHDGPSRGRARWRNGLCVLAAISISLSVCLTKQHAVADVAAGGLLAWAARRAAQQKWLALPRQWPSVIRVLMAKCSIFQDRHRPLGGPSEHALAPRFPPTTGGTLPAAPSEER
jgi:hypothetical protein